MKDVMCIRIDSDIKKMLHQLAEANGRTKSGQLRYMVVCEYEGYMKEVAYKQKELKKYERCFNA